MQPHQQRVVDEKTELDTKRAKLAAFFKMPLFAGLPEAEKNRLSLQLNYMNLYSSVLGERIAAF